MSFGLIAQRHIETLFSVMTGGREKWIISLLPSGGENKGKNQTKKKGEQSRREDTEKRKVCREVEMNVSPVQLPNFRTVGDL